MSEHSICLCEPGLFHLKQFPLGSCMLLQLRGFPLCVFIHLSVDSYDGSFGSLLWLLEATVQ